MVMLFHFFSKSDECTILVPLVNEVNRSVRVLEAISSNGITTSIRIGNRAKKASLAPKRKLRWPQDSFRRTVRKLCEALLTLQSILWLVQLGRNQLVCFVQPTRSMDGLPQVMHRQLKQVPFRDLFPSAYISVDEVAVVLHTDTTINNG